MNSEELRQLADLTGGIYSPLADNVNIDYTGFSFVGIGSDNGIIARTAVVSPDAEGLADVKSGIPEITDFTVEGNNIIFDIAVADAYEADRVLRELTERLTSKGFIVSKEDTDPVATVVEEQIEEPQKPKHIVRGIIGALIGCILSILLLIIAGFSKWMYLYAFCVVLHAMCPMTFYELFSKDDLSGGQIVICSMMSSVTTFFGYRLSWTFPLYNAFHEEYGITLGDAYRNVFNCAREGVMDQGQFWLEFILSYGAVIFFYAFAFWLWNRGAKSFLKGLATPNPRR